MDTIPGFSECLHDIQLEIADIFDVYVYGSRIYGTNREDSDWDLMVILQDESEFLPGGVTDKYFEVGIFDLTVMKLQTLVAQIEAHNMQRLELIWSPVSGLMARDLKQFFHLDLKLLRTAVSTISNKCMGYAKILWLKEEDVAKSKKNIFHSIRYCLFGTQIAVHGRIINYSVANQYLTEMMADNEEDWNQINHRYGLIARQMHKIFLSVLN